MSFISTSASTRSGRHKYVSFGDLNDIRQGHHLQGDEGRVLEALLVVTRESEKPKFFVSSTLE